MDILIFAIGFAVGCVVTYLICRNNIKKLGKEKEFFQKKLDELKDRV